MPVPLRMVPAVRPSSSVKSIGWLIGCLLALALFSSRDARAQIAGQAREYPPGEYYLCFRLIDQGDYAKGVQAFRSAARGGIRTSEGPWVDAVCYHTMIGECYYQMGDLAQSLDQFTSAVRLLVAHGNWMLRVEFPVTLEARNSGPRVPINWGTSSRRTIAGRFPTRYPILQGRLDNQNVIQQGGVFALPEFFLINAHEVLRCGALAIRRRGEILGKTSAHDALNEQLRALLVSRPAPPNHWSQSWIDALLGMTYSVTGRTPEAVTELTKSLQIAGQFDHPLTPMALLQLGRLAFQNAQYDSAAKLFHEATVSAAWFEQSDLMEEAFRWGTAAHLVSGLATMNPVLDPAIAWARRERSSLLETSLLIQQAHNAVELSQNAAAGPVLELARRALARTEMIRGTMGARLNYVAALGAFQAGNLVAGESAWNAVMAFQTNPQRPASHRLFEIALVDALALSGNITPRVANELYADVLREPTSADWTTNLVETLTVTVAPNLLAYEHWLAVASERAEHSLCVEIADRIRRLRFFSTLPFGGRILALSWVLEAPKEALPERVVLVRQDLLNRYPQYADLSRKAAELREQIAKLPLAAEDAAALKQQQQLFADLAALSQAQELLLRALALRREAAEFVCPPPLDLKSFQAKLSPRQAVLAFLLTSHNRLYGFLIRRDQNVQWRIDGANPMGRDLAALLRQMGQLDRNTPVELELLRGDAWTPLAADLWDKLTQKLRPDSQNEIEEIILVPDRWLWYVPFESLPIGSESTAPLITRYAVRYAPTVSLALPDGRTANSTPETVIIGGKGLNPSESAAVSKTAAELRKALGKVTEFQGTLPVPSAFLGTACRRVVVFEDVDPLGRAPFDWAPFGVDRDKPGNGLGAWLALPYGAPDQLLLPGYHSVAETALKRSPTGDELFFSACGLLASGSRTVLLSRWRTGGQTSLDLTREFAQEIPFMPASAAWQRSVQLLTEKELDIEREPRIKETESESSLTASHPFFWAGYLVIDNGAVPVVDAPVRVQKK